MQLSKSIKIPLILAGVCWVIEFMEMGLQHEFHSLGIYPRHPSGLIGIVCHPFLHGDLKHLASNTFSFIFLCSSIIFFFPRISRRVILTIYLLTGFGVWLLARPAYHIGASGLIYGFASFLFFIGVFQKNSNSLIISLIIALLYNGMLYGILPAQEGVSWESHLIGAFVGAVVAYYFRNATTEMFRHITTQVGEVHFEGYVNIETPHYKYTYLENGEKNKEEDKQPLDSSTEKN
ncbi:rhomboid family intramembrane serine protease [Limibacter armeniacum]|uniref:rhomboid family intramembrane serine protease n=1 Tax=Limibacter armeniacum TaxID=466084 RepID=UPI002FE648CD